MALVVCLGPEPRRDFPRAVHRAGLHGSQLFAGHGLLRWVADKCAGVALLSGPAAPGTARPSRAPRRRSAITSSRARAARRRRAVTRCVEPIIRSTSCPGPSRLMRPRVALGHRSLGKTHRRAGHDADIHNRAATPSSASPSAAGRSVMSHPCAAQRAPSIGPGPPAARAQAVAWPWEPASSALARRADRYRGRGGHQPIPQPSARRLAAQPPPSSTPPEPEQVEI